MTRFAEQREPRRVPTLDEFMRVFWVASTDQDRLMLWAYLQTGARRSELFRLQWKDVDLPGKRLQLASRKNSAGEWRAAWLPISGAHGINQGFAKASKPDDDTAVYSLAAKRKQGSVGRTPRTRKT